MSLFEKIFGEDTGRNDRGHDRSRDEEIRLATAVLLVEIGEVDGRFSEAERARVLGILESKLDVLRESDGA